MTTTKPDVDLTDGAFYAGDSRSIYKWMRENEPVFRDRNGLAAAATYAAVIEAERNPELHSASTARRETNGEADETAAPSNREAPDQTRTASATTGSISLASPIGTSTR